MIKKLEHIVFFLLVLSFPIQLGKHFWPSFAFVSGIRVDYLSPTVYLSDILAVILFIICAIQYVANKKIRFRFGAQSFFIKASVVILIFLFISMLSSWSPWAAVYGIVRIAEFLCIGRYVPKLFSSLPYSWFVTALHISILWTSVLGIWQFFLQHSVGGLFYLLGERTFNSSTLGAATMSMNGQQILRPYATFPHPNVYAFFLVFALLYVLFSVFPKHRFRRAIFLLSLVLRHTALLLTFSRVILLCYGIFISWFLYTKFPSVRKLLIFFLLSILVGYLAIFSSRFTAHSFARDLTFRNDLSNISFSLLLKYPILGVGLNNLFVHEVSYQRNITPTFLQPVHNMYLLIAVEAGALGLLVFCTFLFQTGKMLRQKLNYKHNPYIAFPTGILLGIVVIAGFFDHYFLTLQQGQLLFTFLLGVSWTKVSSNEELVLEKPQGARRLRNSGPRSHR